MASALTAARYQQVNTEMGVCGLLWIAVDCCSLYSACAYSRDMRATPIISLHL